MDAPENDAHSSGPHNPAEAEVFAAGVLNDFAFGESAGGAAPDAKEYLLKRCRVFDRDVSLVLQNENGPCPLLAIGARSSRALLMLVAPRWSDSRFPCSQRSGTLRQAEPSIERSAARGAARAAVAGGWLRA